METIKTEHAPAPIGPYSQAVRAGNTLYISGQIHMDPQGGELISGTLEEETKRVMDNIGSILEAAEADFSRVVKCSIFLKDMDDFPEVNAAYGKYFQGVFPARETVEVSRLPAGARVEISAIAELS